MLIIVFFTKKNLTLDFQARSKVVSCGVAMNKEGLTVLDPKRNNINKTQFNSLIKIIGEKGDSV